MRVSCASSRRPARPGRAVPSVQRLQLQLAALALLGLALMACSVAALAAAGSSEGGPVSAAAAEPAGAAAAAAAEPAAHAEPGAAAAEQPGAPGASRPDEPPPLPPPPADGAAAAGQQVHEPAAAAAAIEGGAEGEAEDDALPFEQWKASQRHSSAQRAAAAALVSQRGAEIAVNDYASEECGAEIIHTSPKVRSAHNLLRRSPDGYMLSPCTSPTWIVVELCEQILITRIEVANLELFSSMIRVIRFSISDSYPSTDWKELAIVRLQDVRRVQRFSIEDPVMPARFLRLDVLEYTGSEYYCPLSMLRAIGLTMMEEFMLLQEAGKPDLGNLPVETAPSHQTAVHTAATTTAPVRLFRYANSWVAKAAAWSRGLFGSVLTSTKSVRNNPAADAMENTVDAPTTSLALSGPTIWRDTGSQDRRSSSSSTTTSSSAPSADTTEVVAYLRDYYLFMSDGCFCPKDAQPGHQHQIARLHGPAILKAEDHIQEIFTEVADGSLVGEREAVVADGSHTAASEAVPAAEGSLASGIPKDDAAASASEPESNDAESSLKATLVTGSAADETVSSLKSDRLASSAAPAAERADEPLAPKHPTLDVIDKVLKASSDAVGVKDEQLAVDDSLPSAAISDTVTTGHSTDLSDAVEAARDADGNLRDGGMDGNNLVGSGVGASSLPENVHNDLGKPAANGAADDGSERQHASSSAQQEGSRQQGRTTQTRPGDPDSERPSDPEPQHGRGSTIVEAPAPTSVNDSAADSAAYTPDLQPADHLHRAGAENAAGSSSLSSEVSTHPAGAPVQGERSAKTQGPPPSSLPGNGAEKSTVSTGAPSTAVEAGSAGATGSAPISTGAPAAPSSLSVAQPPTSQQESDSAVTAGIDDVPPTLRGGMGKSPMLGQLRSMLLALEFNVSMSSEYLNELSLRTLALERALRKNMTAMKNTTQDTHNVMLQIMGLMEHQQQQLEHLAHLVKEAGLSLEQGLKPSIAGAGLWATLTSGGSAVLWMLGGVVLMAVVSILQSINLRLQFQQRDQLRRLSSIPPTTGFWGGGAANWAAAGHNENGLPNGVRAGANLGGVGLANSGADPYITASGPAAAGHRPPAAAPGWVDSELGPRPSPSVRTESEAAAMPFPEAHSSHGHLQGQPSWNQHLQQHGDHGHMTAGMVHIPSYVVPAYNNTGARRSPLVATVSNSRVATPIPGDDGVVALQAAADGLAHNSYRYAHSGTEVEAHTQAQQAQHAQQAQQIQQAQQAQTQAQQTQARLQAQTRLQAQLQAQAQAQAQLQAQHAAWSSSLRSAPSSAAGSRPWTPLSPSQAQYARLEAGPPVMLGSDMVRGPANPPGHPVPSFAKPSDLTGPHSGLTLSPSISINGGEAIGYDNDGESQGVSGAEAADYGRLVGPGQHKPHVLSVAATPAGNLSDRSESGDYLIDDASATGSSIYSPLVGTVEGGVPRQTSQRSRLGTPYSGSSPGQAQNPLAGRKSGSRSRNDSGSREAASGSREAASGSREAANGPAAAGVVLNNDASASTQQAVDELLKQRLGNLLFNLSQELVASPAPRSATRSSVSSRGSEGATTATLTAGVNSRHLSTSEGVGADPTNGGAAYRPVVDHFPPADARFTDQADVEEEDAEEE